MIPLEILSEPISKPDESLLRDNIQSSTKQDEKSEIQNEENKPNLSDKRERSLTVEEKKPLKSTSSTATIQSGHSSDTKSLDSLQNKYNSSLSINEDEIEDLYLKTRPINLSQSFDSNLSLPHGSTSSLDRDKISIDSLDVTQSQRNLSNNK